ncbi:hypothetical protein [Psychrobacillus sp. FSL H8-0487]|uniref:hypothetical protein n=1 Tax=Psychrobacillus sp. FSL H8-0487 TaxID=2921391 RepID=UPI0030FC0FDA
MGRFTLKDTNKNGKPTLYWDEYIPELNKERFERFKRETNLNEAEARKAIRNISRGIRSTCIGKLSSASEFTEENIHNKLQKLLVNGKIAESTYNKLLKEMNLTEEDKAQIRHDFAVMSLYGFALGVVKMKLKEDIEEELGESVTWSTVQDTYKILEKDEIEEIRTNILGFDTVTSKGLLNARYFFKNNIYKKHLEAFKLLHQGDYNDLSDEFLVEIRNHQVD